MQALAQRLATAPRLPWPSEPVPVSLVITELDVGGAENALVSLATGLDRARWRPSVIALGPEGPLAAPIRDAGVPVECLGVNPKRPLRAVLRLATALRRQRPELLQSFLFHANVAARLATLFIGRPRPWVLGGLRVAERQKRWHRVLERWTAPLGAGSVCVSEGVRRFSRDLGGWPDDRLTVIPNGVDVSLFDRASPASRSSLGVPEGALLVLFVGRLSIQKGLTTLLDAAERVLAAENDRESHLVLAGDGPEREALRARAASSPALAKRIHPLGLRRDIPALMTTADVLVLPSLWEGMPNAVLEAMAARRAVVATEVEGTEDLVVPGETGWLVPPGDAKALAAALLEAADDRARLQRFGEAGRTRVEAQFTVARTVTAYEQLWARILGFEEPQQG